MSGFAFACMTPHGSEIIEELSPRDPLLMKATRDSMRKLGAEMERAAPDTIVVLTPHGVRVEGQFSVSDSVWLAGDLEDGATVAMERRVDRALALGVSREAEQRGLPVARVNFAVREGPLSRLPMDWGALVPLYFMPPVDVVSITSSRTLSYEDHVRFGEALADAVKLSGKRVGLIASCDWAHAHAEDGPYGFHPDAADLDREVRECIRSGDLEDMMAFAPEFVENAKPDGVWQALILAGAIPKGERRPDLLSYEVPTYFGLLCASFL